ncbi:hypothetical protein AeMF1_019161 [Aphanomyces euteiches]|nr:hypothetical protein AeMF1_019161 [Aphanomyces euteiches]KAH9189031.1 hypothetical protein AeNC1_008994 [Aphanomyces euteiches]
MYYHHTNLRTGTIALTIAGLFKQDDCVVMTHCYVARDELFPHREGVLRPHGFSWTVFEAANPEATLIHNYSIQYTPFGSNGRVIPLEMIGKAFGRSAFGIQHRDAYIQLIHSAAERAFIDSHTAMIRETTNRAA